MAGDSDPGARTIDVATIIKILRRSVDPVLVSKRALLEDFIQNVFPNLPRGASVDDELSKYIEEQKKLEIQKQHEETEIAYEDLAKLLARYEYFGAIDTADVRVLLSKKVKKKFQEKHPDFNIIKANNELIKQIKEWVITMSARFSIAG